MSVAHVEVMRIKCDDDNIHQINYLLYFWARRAGEINNPRETAGGPEIGGFQSTKRKRAKLAEPHHICICPR